MTFDYGKWRKKETTSKLYYLIPDGVVRPNAKDTKKKMTSKDQAGDLIFSICLTWNTRFDGIAPEYNKITQQQG